MSFMSMSLSSSLNEIDNYSCFELELAEIDFTDQLSTYKYFLLYLLVTNEDNNELCEILSKSFDSDFMSNLENQIISSHNYIKNKLLSKENDVNGIEQGFKIALDEYTKIKSSLEDGNNTMHEEFLVAEKQYFEKAVEYSKMKEFTSMQAKYRYIFQVLDLTLKNMQTIEPKKALLMAVQQANAPEQKTVADKRISPATITFAFNQSNKNEKDIGKPPLYPSNNFNPQHSESKRIKKR